MLTKGVVLLQNNRPAQKTRVARTTDRQRGFDKFEHPSTVRTRAFTEETTEITETWLKERSENLYFSGVDG